ncbi:MAG: efflux RND transporter permease subunit [Candidatus Auribacter fodinae]|uniref:Efflux RND transporter permease subunit n=1 Tax=Candidatus Auribacter fodinae TaxID=2093366 RepID=A0A3A4R611_9BACT|nr:MAG: efflux RND transporter permease subunit [Candidatus Auribacter fodinae]
MDLIKTSIEKPVSVTVGVILVLLFGVIGLIKLPVQLTPDVENPQITVETIWAGATPDEIEKDIIEKQEDALKSVRGLTVLESSSYNSYGEIILTFRVGTNLDDALLRVSNKLEEVPDYPENAERPIINASGAQASPIIWMMLKTKEDNERPITTYRTFFENEVRQFVERVPGVGSLFVFGGSEQQLEVVVDPVKLAKHQLTFGDVLGRLQSSNDDVAAGLLGLEKKNVRVRTKIKFRDVDAPLDVTLYDDGLRRVLVSDVAFTRLGYAYNDVSVMQNGMPVIAIGVRNEQGANVLNLTEDVRNVVSSLNKGILAENGLFIEWVYDQVPYINTAINTVKNNVMVGGVLAVIVLLLFLRSVTSTIAVAVSIPISAIGTFIFMWLLGRNFNVVSLAGISFAVGMLVDNSIVVLENIDRHRNLGKSPFAAAYDGTKEVWGAVLASTLTTIAVFLPVIFIQQEAGQLFRDIAIAITFSILLSLFVSVSVIPMISNKLFHFSEKKFGSLFTSITDKTKKGKENFCVRIIMFFSAMSLRNCTTRILTIVILTALSFFVTVILLPKAEYLPQGNRNLVLNIMIPPPGYSVAKRKEIGDYIFRETGPYFKEDYKDGIPKIRNIFFVAADRIMLFGGISAHDTEASGMMPLFSRVMNSVPGIFGVSIQAGIFQNRIGQGRTIDINISGSTLNRIIEVAQMLFGATMGAIPNAQIRPVPSLEISYPEANIVPDRDRILANGFSEEELGVYVDILMDGRKIGEYKPKGMKQIDLVFRSDAQDIQTPEDILNSLISTKYGSLVRMGDVAALEYDQGMTQIYHLERFRTVKLEVTPPPELPLEEAMNIIENGIIQKMKDQGALAGVSVRVGGNADKLTETRRALQWNFVLAVIITYLLMSALFENFLYPFIILFSVPLAAAGGFIGLRLVDQFVAPQSFDVLTMLGFIILIGTVVNNAILIVYQALNNVRFEGMKGIAAITDSIRTRIRPIFMSTMTSLFGLFPLVISTGSGSELYRGLGSVLLGGLAISTIFTLFIIPALLAFFINLEKPREMHGF